MFIREKLAISLVVALGMSGSALGGTVRAPPSIITVKAVPESVAHWSSRIGENLSREMDYPSTFGVVHEGLVKISFHCAGGSAPVGMTIRSSSGWRDLDRAGLRAVANIRGLSPLPIDLDQRRPMEAWVVFGSDASSVQRMIKAANTALVAERAIHPQIASTRSVDLEPMVIASR